MAIGLLKGVGSLAKAAKNNPVTTASTGLAGVGVAQTAASGNTGKAALEGTLLAGSFIPGPVGWASAGLGLVVSMLPDVDPNDPTYVDKAASLFGFDPAFMDKLGGGSGIGETGSSLALSGVAPSAGGMTIGSDGLPVPGSAPPITPPSGERSGSSSFLGGGTASALGFGGLMAGKLGRGGRSGGGRGIGGGSGGGFMSKISKMTEGSVMPPPPKEKKDRLREDLPKILQQDRDRDRSQIESLSSVLKGRGGIGGGSVPRANGGISGSSGPQPSGMIQSTSYSMDEPSHSDSYNGRIYNAAKHRNI